MSCPLSRTRRPVPSRSARRTRYVSRQYRLSHSRKEEAGRVHDAQRARLRRLSRAAGRSGSILCPEHGQVGCNLHAHICVAICRNKSVPCPGGLRRECVAGAIWSDDLEEAHNDG